MTAEQRFNAWQERYGDIDPHRIRAVRLRPDCVLEVVGKSGNCYPLSDDPAIARRGRKIIVEKEYERSHHAADSRPTN